MTSNFERVFNRFLNMTPAEVGISAELMGVSPEAAAALHQFQSDSQSARQTPSRIAQFDHLVETPGVDMVLQVAHEGARSLPKSGWIVGATIAPGNTGKIESYRYDEGGLQVSTSTDTEKLVSSLENYGSARLYMDFISGKSLVHTAGYENPDYPFKDKQPYERGIVNYLGYGFDDLDVLKVSNGGRILSLKKPYSVNLFTGIDYVDLNKDSVRQYSPAVDINRVTEDPEELVTIAEHLASGMGLSAEDSANFANASVGRIIL